MIARFIPRPGLARKIYNAPFTGQRHSSTTKQGPLSGVRIVDLSRVLAGPFCTQILADYGADVIKVEHPQGGDDTRLWREPGEDKFWKPETKNTSLYFNTINRNKRSIAVNLKQQKGREVILDLVKGADVVVDNFIPGKLEALGLGYEVFKKANPGIIHASISGYGPTGPSSTRAGYDAIAAAEGALLHITGTPDGPPVKPGVGIIDLCTGLYLHGAIASALYARSASAGVPQGQKINTSLFESALSILTNVGTTWLNLRRDARRWGTGHPSIVPYGAFKTADGALFLAAVNNRQFATLCARLGVEGVARDARFSGNDDRVQNRDALEGILRGVLGGKTNKEWTDVLEGSGIAYGVVNDVQGAFGHEQVAARDMVKRVRHDGAEGGFVDVIGIPVEFSETVASVRERPPGLGEHSQAILREMGVSEEDMKAMREGGVI